MIEKIAEEEMQKYQGVSVGELLDFIKRNNIPMSSKIFIERIEDVYFEKHHWAVIEKEQDYHEIHQYHIAWCPVKYKDSDKLFIDLHY